MILSSVTDRLSDAVARHNCENDMGKGATWGRATRAVGSLLGDHADRPYDVRHDR